MWKRRALTVLLVIPLVAVALLLVIVSRAGSSAGGSLSSGRSIMAFSDSIYLANEFSSDTATIKTGFREIIVQPTALVVDRVPVATIDPRVRRVEVRVQKGAVTFIADGKAVPTSVR